MKEVSKSKFQNKQSQSTSNGTSWGKVADWYDDVLGDPDSYQNKVILPNVLRILSLKAPEKVLDVACGQGFFATEFAKSGATVSGIDISPELIAIAKRNSPNISYTVSSADNLSMFSEGSFDAITIILALQNIEKISQVFKECRRVLTKDGKLVIVINHPVLRIPHTSSWGFDDVKKIQYRRLDSYLSESKHEIAMHPGKKGGEKTITFHRPLQMYVKNLSNAGFAITRLEEWTSHKTSEDGPRKEAENKARKEFPLFMCMECTSV